MLTNLDPWIRVCNSNNGAWESAQFAVVCTNFESGSSAQTFGASSIGLSDDIVVYNGEGCDEDASDLKGGYIKYGSTTKSLQDGCGSRDHGVTCEFTY
ncbi:uncharacterized protein BO80DRAFT_476869 [Aspergillus ibericus CBS 121593]|uniref:Uncharacterized protein n=1 Tax=Aspergillus ibericus CBS 121593 TaxID=1448316 RepID=A0A395H0T3_9EURO|nr:hypothetical protein BO80DRAFT_476869 [Aspergillus ibericus CBS 121593]RAK99903.1 hypothetical protein BO80DRAFT_476869 [Aspergillus ibericus CBS 121593]